MGPSEDAEGGGVDERDARDVDDDARAAEGQGLTQADRDVVSREDVELAVGGQDAGGRIEGHIDREVHGGVRSVGGTTGYRGARGSESREALGSVTLISHIPPNAAHPPG